MGVVAVAKTDLRPGDLIDQLGGFEVYGVAENSDSIDAENLLPLGLALGSTIVRPVKKDQPLVFADVRLPAGRTIDQLYAEQRARFGRPAMNEGYVA